MLVRQGAGGIQYAVLEETEAIYLRLTSGPNGVGGYEWVEVWPGPLGTWIEADRVGNVANTDLAYELNHRLDLAAGTTVYQAKRGVTSGEWLFRSRRSCP